jgi:hypothetical protein
MKPKIKKVGNKWLCYTNFSVVACGDSPEAAYNKWMALNDGIRDFESIRSINNSC